MLLTSLLMMLAEIWHPLSIYNLTIPLFFLFYLSGILYPSYFIRSTLLFRDISASSNALFNTAAFFISGIATGLGTWIKLNTALPFMMSLCAIICSCTILQYFQRR